MYKTKKSDLLRLKFRAPIALRENTFLDIPRGWYSLVYDACAQIEDYIWANYNLRNTTAKQHFPKIYSIEFNYAKLNIKLRNSDEKIEKITFNASKKSTKICVICGETCRSEINTVLMMRFCDLHWEKIRKKKLVL